MRSAGYLLAYFLGQFDKEQMHLLKCVALLLLIISILTGISGKLHLLTAKDQQPKLETGQSKASESNRLATVSQPAPHFEGTAVINEEFVKISLRQFSGRYVVLVFYPLDFASISPTEIMSLSNRIAEFRKLNAVVITCSVDSPLAHLTWIRLRRREGGLGCIKIPMLSDLHHKISKDYGVYMPELGHSQRALFIIDSSGIIRQAMVNDESVGRSVDEILRLVKASQYVDATGGGCPANWQPKMPTKCKKNKKLVYPATKLGFC